MNNNNKISPWKVARKCVDLSDFSNLINRIIEDQNRSNNTQYTALSLKRIAHYYYNSDDKYSNFTIPKKSGKLRNIDAPDPILKKIQRRINLLLSSFFEPKKCAHGFIEGRSIVTNAHQHIGKKYVLNIDLKDFFPSVHYGRVKAVLKLPPFHFKESFAHLIANFCCYNGVLPQGAPTSPVITNIVCQRLDRKLVNFAKDHKCLYSRYADDLSFSSDKHVFDGVFFKLLNDVISEEGFGCNVKKTRLLYQSQRQEVTGITVNEKLNVKRQFIHEIRAMLYNLKMDGVKICQQKMDALRGESESKSFLKVLNGKIVYLGMVRGHTDALYLRFRAMLKDNLNKIN